MRFPLLAVLLLSGCAHYVTPGAAVRLQDIDRADIAEVAARKPSPNFPARLAVARVQANGYKSYSNEAHGSGSYSVMTTQELATEEQFQALSKWPAVAGVAPVSRMLLPAQLRSLDDLRLSAAKLQADVLLVYTVDTSFRVNGRGYGPLATISLGTLPDRDAHVTSTASALFIDVRTGFIYGASEATAKASGLTSFWGSQDTVDRKRLEAERDAFGLLVAEAGKTWSGIAGQYAR